MNIHFKDGDAIKKGDVIAEFKGHTCAMLKAERTALNLLQHMSGIASYTNKCVKAVEGTDASIADTRKTLPGLRPLQKYSVVAETTATILPMRQCSRTITLTHTAA